MRFQVFVAAAAMLAGCAVQSTQQLDAKMNGWIGADINSLIAKWGPPARVDTLPNGSRMYTYIKDGSYTTPTYVQPAYRAPSTTTTQIYGNTMYSTTTPGQSYGGAVVGGQRVERTCAVSFTTDRAGDRVAAWRYDGACRALL